MKLKQLGGQAIIEGVMLRSEHYMAATVRTVKNKIVVLSSKWFVFKTKLRQIPFIRGFFQIIETLINGYNALMFSAKQAGEDEESNISLTISIILSIFFVIVFFLALPHFLTMGLNVLGLKITVNSLLFHIIDGLFKLIIFIIYISLMSFSKELRKIFQYHGAEHMIVFTYENNKDLTVKNAKQYDTKHSRCGTSFIMVIILISIIISSIIFPFIPINNYSFLIKGLLHIIIKVLLIFPILGISFEIIKNVDKFPWLKTLLYPGILIQYLTTKKPTVEMLEIAIISAKKVIELETKKPNLEKPIIESI